MADGGAVAGLHAPTHGRTDICPGRRTDLCPDDTTGRGADRHDSRLPTTQPPAPTVTTAAPTTGDRATRRSHPERLAGKQADPTNSSWM